MWKMLQPTKAGDYVIATGEMHSVREFVVAAFVETGITISWSGSGTKEVGTDAETGVVCVRADLQDQGREAYLKQGGYKMKRYHE
jgi:GDPmannose 4,6-dehydratase